VEITADDIGKTVLTRDGDTFTLTGFQWDSRYPIISNYRSWTTAGHYYGSVECPEDIVGFMSTDWNSTSTPYVSCEHEWVGSGFPGGDVWCKLCDTTYNESTHGDSGL